LVEQRTLNVALDDESFWWAVWIFFLSLNNRFYLLKCETYLNAVSSIWILTWLDNPWVVLFKILMIFTFSLFSLFYLFSSFVVIFEKLEPTLVFKSIFYMESQWQIVEDIFTFRSVIIGHCIEQSLFITNHIIVDQMILKAIFSYLWGFNNFSVLEWFLPI